MIRWIILALLLLAGCAGNRWDNDLPFKDVDSAFYPGTYARIGNLLREEDHRAEIPGGSLAIWKGGLLVYTNSFGRLAPTRYARRVDRETLFDVASLTKAMAGAPTAVLLLEQAESDRDVDSILILTGHKSGLDDEDVFPEIRHRMEAERLNLEELRSWLALQTKDGASYHYSNAGYVLLALKAEDIASADTLRAAFWKPIDLKALTYHPNLDEEARVAASGHTEDGELVTGRPFDPVADAMLQRDIAIPLHSGLFATAGGVAEFGGGLLSTAEQKRIQSLRSLLLGGPYPQQEDVYTTPGGLVSPIRGPFAPQGADPGRVYMLTGFTGCLLWVDTRTGTAVGLLTNASANDALDRWESFSQRIIQEVIRGSR